MTNDEPRGVGGWLLLFCLGQVYFGPSRAFQAVFQIWDRIGPHPFPVIRQMANILVVVIVVLTVYGVVVGFIIWKGNKLGRTAARQYLLVRVGVSIVIFGSGTAWGYNALGVSGAKRMMLAVISPCSLEIGTGLLWFAYFTYSKRVRNTYGGEAPD